MKRVIIILIALILIGVIAYGVNDYFEYPRKVPIRPIESEPNKILVTSDACCSMAYDLKLTLHNKQTGEKSVIYTAEQVSEFEVLKHKLPKADVEDFEIILSCDVYYGENYLFEKTIVDGSDYNEFRKSGLLINLQEGDGVYLNIITNDKHDTYKLMYDEEEKWELKSTPNKIFPE